jgi:hypothetical protein
MKTILILTVIIVSCSPLSVAADDDMTTTVVESVAIHRCASHYETCPEGEYCREQKVGQCPNKKHFGVCAVKPTRCQDIYKPVCGCDGVTYTNACQAAAAGVAVRKAGACQPQGS